MMPEQLDSSLAEMQTSYLCAQWNWSFANPFLKLNFTERVFSLFTFHLFNFYTAFFSMAYLSFTQDNKRENKVVETEIKMLKQMPTWN